MYNDYAIAGAARNFIKDKPISKDDKDAFVYCVCATYHSTVSKQTLQRMYDDSFKKRELHD